jgi:hypothetical protein
MLISFVHCVGARSQLGYHSILQDDIDAKHPNTAGDDTAAVDDEEDAPPMPAAASAPAGAPDAKHADGKSAGGDAKDSKAGAATGPAAADGKKGGGILLTADEIRARNARRRRHRVRGLLADQARALRDLSAKTDDGLVVGRLHAQSIALKQQIHELQTALAQSQTDGRAAGAAVARLEKELDDRHTDLFRIQNHFRARIEAAERTITQLQIETHVAGVLPGAVSRPIDEKKSASAQAAAIVGAMPPLTVPHMCMPHRLVLVV